MTAPTDVSRPTSWEAGEDGPEELDAGDMYDDAAAKTALYARLSRNAAADGDVVIAVAAAWAADVSAVQALWWERARDAGGAPFEPFLGAGSAIALGQEAVVPPVNAAGRDDLRSAGGVVETARRGLLAAFDPPAVLLVAGRLATVDHLTALPAPRELSERPAGAPLQPFAARLAGRALPAVLDELWTVALDARTVARALESAGFAREAVEQLVQAETAHFEAFLLRSAVAVGDVDLLGADLRRALLADLLPAPLLLPQDVAGAQRAVRDVMRVVLGGGELGRYARLLAVYDAAEIAVELPEHLTRALVPVVPPAVLPVPIRPAPVDPVASHPGPLDSSSAHPQPADPEPADPVSAPPVPARVLPAHAVRVDLVRTGSVDPSDVLPHRAGPGEPFVVPAPGVGEPSVVIKPDAGQPAAVVAPRVEPRTDPVEGRAGGLLGDLDYLDTLLDRAAEVAQARRRVPAADRVADPTGPPGEVGPAEPLRHRDIHAQDIGGQGPRLSGLGPARPAAPPAGGP